MQVFKYIKDTDFEDFDSSSLYQELVTILDIPGDPQKWYLSTSSQEIKVTVVDNTLTPLDSTDLETAVNNVIQTHGSSVQILQRAKNSKVIEIKAYASLLFDTKRPDYKVDRHRSQQDLGVQTSITGAEYIQYIQDRNDIRVASDDIEAVLNVLTVLADVEGFDIAGRSEWPSLD